MKLTKVSRERNLVFAALKATESNAVQAVTDQAAEDGKDSSAAAQTESAGQAEKASDEYDVTDLPDGIYMVDFKLWQYAKNDVSMGNPAIMDAYPDTKGQQAKLEVKDGEIFLYLEFQKMKFNGDTGHLLAMEIMKDLQTTEDGTILDWTPDEPEILEYTDETDDYGPPAGSKYPKLLKFELTDYIVDREGKVTDRIPVQVDVPVMRPANEQPAYLRFYWNTLKPAATKSGADVSELSKTLEEAGKLLKEDGYVKFTKDALQASVDAGNELKLCAVEANVTQDMVDKRQEALVKTMAALIKSSVETESVDKSPLSASISLAKSLVSSSYTLETWNAVDARLDEAQEVNKDRDATLEEVNAATVSLLGAVQALERKPSNVTEEEEYDVADGYYKIKVRLWHSSMNKKSMGDPAVKGTSYVHVEDGEATMRLVTEKMSTSGITTHLYDFFIEENGDYKDADLISTEDSKWIFQFDLPSVGKEFYKCEVDPRVDVMGTDPVPARLRLDWDSISNITESQWDDLEGTVHQSDGRAKFSVRLRDEETGVTVTGNTGGTGVLLETEKKESGAEYDKVSAAVGPSANQFVVYDIKLRNEDEYVQPPEPLKLRLPIPAGYDTTKLLMYRLNDDGSGEWIEGRVTGSYYEATVDHFSIYALVECREDIETVLGGGLGTEAGGGEAAPADTNAATASDAVQTAGTVVQEVNGRVIPYTGDDTPVEKMAAAAAAALMIFAATFLPKRKKKEDAENGGV